MAIALKITQGPTNAFQVAKITLGVGAGTGTPGTDGTNGTDGEGVPIGGATGEVLTKTSGTDFDTEWAAGGGGGGDWELVTTRVLSGLLVELFDPGANNRVKFEFRDFTVSGGLRMAMSVDAGVSYPATHRGVVALLGRSNNAALSSTITNNLTYYIMSLLTSGSNHSMDVTVDEITEATYTNVYMPFFKYNSGTIMYNQGYGQCELHNTGVVDMIKFITSTGGALTSGTIKMFKYVGD